MDKVSIILPTYNSSKYIDKLCSSILNQTHQNFEVLVIDNMSNDNTIQKIQDWTKEDKRFKYHVIDNKGVIGKSRNLGISKSNCDYLAFHDSDDFWYRKKLEISLKYLKKYDFTYHYLRTIDKKNFLLNYRKLFSYQLSNEPFIDLLTKGNPISTSSVMCKKSIFEKENLFSEEKKLIGIEDYDCWVNLSKKGYRFKEIPILLGRYLIGYSNTSHKIKKNSCYKIFYILNKNNRFLKNKDKIYSKNYFRYLFANDIENHSLKFKIYYYLFFQKNIKIFKIKILIKLIISFIKKRYEN